MSINFDLRSACLTVDFRYKARISITLGANRNAKTILNKKNFISKVVFFSNFRSICLY